jgi:aryl-alcohol dehydrogenase-like predicted oxidoreductase
MNYRYLGRTGLQVSVICLGTMTFGWGTDESLSRQMLDKFVELGGNFIDTADIYADGMSETIIGHWLKDKPRDALVIATKVRYATGAGPNKVGLNRKHILAAVEASLRRLQTDYIDLYQIHCWDETTPLEETLSTLDTLVKSGKVRYVGVSNFTGWQLQKAIDLGRHRGWEPFASLQALYNLLDRYLEWDILPVCRNEGLGLLCWSPLGGGWLTGRIRRGMSGPPDDSRVKVAEQEGWSESWSNYNEDRTWDVLDELFAVADEVGKSPAQVAINWLLNHPHVTCPIIGARTMPQFKDNVTAVTWSLSDGQMKRLNQASKLTPPRYPYGFIGRFNASMTDG